METIIRKQSENLEVRKKNSEESRTFTFIASDNSKDSHGTVVPVDKWNLERFNSNGVIGYQHDLYYSSNPDNVIGKGHAYIEDDLLLVDITFEPEEINPLAEKIYQKVKFGTLKAVSVGFAPTSKGHWGEGDEAPGEKNETYYYDGQELLEVSIVNIPSNANALKRGMFTDEEIATLSLADALDIVEKRAIVEELPDEDAQKRSAEEENEKQQQKNKLLTIVQMRLHE